MTGVSLPRVIVSWSRLARGGQVVGSLGGLGVQIERCQHGQLPQWLQSVRHAAAIEHQRPQEQLPVQPGRTLRQPRGGRRQLGGQPRRIQAHGEQPVRRQLARRREGVPHRVHGGQPLVLRQPGAGVHQPAAEHPRQPVRLRGAGEGAHRIRDEARAGPRRDQRSGHRADHRRRQSDQRNFQPLHGSSFPRESSIQGSYDAGCWQKSPKTADTASRILVGNYV